MIHAFHIMDMKDNQINKWVMSSFICQFMHLKSDKTYSLLQELRNLVNGINTIHKNCAENNLNGTIPNFIKNFVF